MRHENTEVTVPCHLFFGYVWSNYAAAMITFYFSPVEDPIKGLTSSGSTDIACLSDRNKVDLDSSGRVSRGRDEPFFCPAMNKGVPKVNSKSRQEKTPGPLYRNWNSFCF